MAVEETKHDLLLKRTQITIAILAGLATLVLGIYNVKKTVFQDSGNGQIQAQVHDDRGRSISGARVELYNLQNALVASSQTDENGGFARKDVPAGGYVFKTSASGFEPSIVTIQVSSKKTTDFDVDLRALPSASQGQASGNPLQSALQEVGASWIKKIGQPKSTEAKS